MALPHVMTPITAAPGGAANTVAATLADGRVIEIWSDTTSIWARYYDSSGAMAGAPFIAMTPAGFVGDPVVAATGDGGWMVVFPTFDSTFHGATSAAVFNAAGTMTGGPFALLPTGESGGSLVIDPHSGQTVFAYNRPFDSTTGTPGAPCVAFGNIDGSAGPIVQILRPPSLLGAGSRVLSLSSPKVAELASGEYAVSYVVQETPNDFSITQFETWVNIYRADGSLARTSLAFQAAPNQGGGQATVTALTDGGFAVACQFAHDTGLPGAGTDVAITLFNADGSQRGAPIVLDNAKMPEIAGLSNGLLAVMWTEAQAPLGTPNAVMQQVFLPDGSAYGAAFLVDAGGTQGGATVAPSGSVTALPNGGFLDIFIHSSAAHDGEQIAYTTAPPPPVLVGMGVRSGTGEATRGAVSGLGQPGDTISLTDRGVPIGHTTVAADGTWSIAPARPVGGALHVLRVVETDSLGTSSTSAGQFTALARSTGGGVAMTGDDGANVLTGGVADDWLDGGGGADTMAGGAGHDIYVVDSVGDTVTELFGAGTDRILARIDYALVAGAPIEFLIADAGATGLVLSGNALGNHVIGGAGDDTISGGGGRDLLIGAAGADTFVLHALEDSTVSQLGRATISDFSQFEHDLIDLRPIDANATAAGDQAFTFIEAAAFSGAPGELSYAIAGANTVVSGDVDGDRNADFTIRLKGMFSLVATDFKL